MNYTKIYASIVLRAQAERTERLALKKQGQYFENHHIIPKSLGGKNNKCNMALLTAREHFICHWLLVKIYPFGSNEHNKMVCALWRMRSTNVEHRRYINARTYETMRCHFAHIVGTITSKAQSGQGNSHFGTKWYTNYVTGETKLFRAIPVSSEWVVGRNVFSGQSSSLKFKPAKDANLKYQTNDEVNRQGTTRVTPRHGHKQSRTRIYTGAIKRARERWDRYHAGSYAKLEDFSKELKISKVALYYCFKKFIPKYTSDKMVGKRTHYPSNKSLVGVYT